MSKTGATCEIIDTLSDGSKGICGVPAAGRCSTCHRAFCQSHQSYDRGDGFWTELDLCKPCQNKQVEAKAEQERIAAEKAAEEQREREDKRRRQQAQAAWKRHQEQQQQRKREESFFRGLAPVGLAIAVVGVGSGWLVADDWKAWAGVPYAVFAMISILLSAAGLRFTATGAAAAVGSVSIASVGFLFLLATMVVQLWRIWIEHQSVGWGQPVAALIGAISWLGGAGVVAGSALCVIGALRRARMWLDGQQNH